MKQEMTADDVIDVKSWLPTDAYVEAAIVIVQLSHPGGETREERGPWLWTKRDTNHGVWNQLGMVESVANDMRAMLREVDDGE